jgi:spermidine synthase
MLPATRGLIDTLTALLVVLACVLVDLYGLRLCRAGSDAKAAPPAGWRRWITNCEVSPRMLGGFSYWQLALVSVAGLFLELLLIRWISSEIRIFAYFKNFVLIACFLGFGLGCHLSRRPINLTVMLFPLLVLAAICELPVASLRTYVDSITPLVGGISGVDIWGVPSLPLNAHTLLVVPAALLFVVPMFGLIALVFVPIGQLVGWYLEHATDGITAYTVNVLGSLAGIVLYTGLCFLSQPPAIWFLLAGAMLVWLFWKRPWLRWTSVAAFLLCAGISEFGMAGGTGVYWSPYQKLTLWPVRDSGKVVSYQLETNGSWYQQILDLRPEFAATHPARFANAPVEWNTYNLPYRFYPSPPSVLVLGAGTGNDAAAALRNGAGRVVAVEIDPLILDLGRELHFEKPYDSPRAHVVIDDARSYVQNSTERFDLIVFSLLDSHTTSSYYSNIRIDNYVYTLEALRATRKLLKPDGLMIIKFQVNTPWIAGRLHDLVQTVFGQPPLQMRGDAPLRGPTASGGTVYIAGSQTKIAQALRDPRLAEYVGQHNDIAITPAAVTTDDWPYFYQHQPGLPASVIIVSVALILFCWLFLRQTGPAVGAIRWHFFFLGAGFLLLEAQIISKMALLFGTTWVVNSIVIAGLLILVVAANLLVARVPRIPVAVGYAGIFASMLVAWAIPLETFFFQSTWLKALAATGVLCLPVFFAGIVFIRGFAKERFSAEALGSNLFGALVGGLLESLSMWTGIRSLLVIAALFYLASWIVLRTPVPAAAETALP